MRAAAGAALECQAGVPSCGRRARAVEGTINDKEGKGNKTVEKKSGTGLLGDGRQVLEQMRHAARESLTGRGIQ